MTPLLLFLLGCAVTYLGTVSAAFNALMRLSLRIHAERTDRDDALGRYLEDPRRFFIPARILISIAHDARRRAAGARHRLRYRRLPGAGVDSRRDRADLRAPHPAADRPARSRARARRSCCRRSTWSRACSSRSPSACCGWARAAAAGPVGRRRPSGARKAANGEGPAGRAAVKWSRRRQRRSGGGAGRAGARAVAQPRRLPRDDGARGDDAAARHHRHRQRLPPSSSSIRCSASSSIRACRCSRRPSTTCRASSSSRT